MQYKTHLGGDLFYIQTWKKNIRTYIHTHIYIYLFLNSQTSLIMHKSF